MCPKDLVSIVEELIKVKRNTPEIGYGPKIPEINSFIEEELERHGVAFSGQGRPDILESKSIREELNNLFRDIVRDA